MLSVSTILHVSAVLMCVNLKL